MALGMTSSELSPDDVMRSLNQQLANCVPRGDHMTGVMLKISADGQVVGCSAGGPPCFIVADNKPAVLIFTGGGQALGMFAEERIPYFQERFRLNSGDRLVLFTDGIPEWRNRKDQPFGLDAMKRYLEKHSRDEKTDLLKGLLAEAAHFADPVAQHDDITMIALEFKRL
jgi:sigma-B regulation protein RsbU (phosphoserine phosphatase)